MLPRLLFLLFWVLITLSAGTPPAGFAEFPVAQSLNQPTAFTFAPDGRIFVCEQSGSLRVIKEGALLPAPLLTVLVDDSVERGLLGVAVDPEFASNHWVYVYYTVGTVTPRHNRVSRFTTNGDVASPDSELILLELEDLTDSPTHNGGALRFGPDGKLYVAVGENGVGANAQQLTTLLGKLLRMNKDGTVPSDNPQLGTFGRYRLIWAYGLRNPFTFNFDPQSGQLFINDVGQSDWEEINAGVAGANYGWPNSEGPTANPAYVSPYYSYSHTTGFLPGCAISGGAFYHPSNPTFPASYVGKYFFSDLCGGTIAFINHSGDPSPTLFLTDAVSPVGIEVSPDGDLYYLERGTGGSTGSLKRIHSTAPQPPFIITQPTNVQTVVGGSATFTVAAAPQPLSYQWQRNSVPIPGANSSSYTLTGAQLSDSGAAFRVLITNSLGTVSSNSAVITVLLASAPAAVILSPPEGASFSAGETISFSAAAQDQFQNVIAPSTFHWRVDYVTGSATRPFVQEFSGPSGSFSVPVVTPYTLPDVYFLIHLDVMDSQGLATSITRRVDPRVTQFTISSSPPGLQLTLDGQPFTAPRGVSSVVGLVRPIGAVTPQETAGMRHVFQSWSDGGPATHDISVREGVFAYVATFEQQYFLTTIAVPAGGGTIGGGGWVRTDLNQTVSATPAIGYRFTGFSGDLTGASPQQTILMNAPHTVTANFACLSTLSSSSLTATANGVGAVVAVSTGTGCNWSVTGLPDWITLNSGSPGTGSGSVSFIIQLNSGTSRSATLNIAGEPFVVTQAGSSAPCTFQLSSNSASSTAAGGLLSVTVTTGPNCTWNVITPDAWAVAASGNSGTGPGSITFSVGTNSSVARTSQVSIGGQPFTLTQAGSSTAGSTQGLGFVAMQPCRLMETRPEYNFQGRSGTFGPPFLNAGESRTLIPSQQSICQVPATAKAYMLNVTLVPRGSVDHVTLWAAGSPRPEAWTIRSLEGLIVANSAIVPAGLNGGIAVYASHNTDVLIDISGYFTDDRSVSTTVYYPMTPCRVIETRSLYRPEPGPFGPPALSPGERRSYRFPASSPYCQVKEGAMAYSVTITAVPPAPLAFLTAWPASGEQPNVSTLNSPAGRVVANSMIVPARADGSIEIMALDRTDVLVDITGYFAADDGNGLSYFPVTQCRAYDSQNLGILPDDSTRTINVPAASPCAGVPSNARAYALNVTALPNGQPMPFLTVYATGEARPNASILNAFEGQVMTNSAIVPAGPNGTIDVYVLRRTNVVVEVSGYFRR